MSGRSQRADASNKTQGNLTHEQVIGIRIRSADAEKLHQVVELTVYVTAHSNRAFLPELVSTGRCGQKDVVEVLGRKHDPTERRNLQRAARSILPATLPLPVPFQQKKKSIVRTTWRRHFSNLR